jgi:luciferase family oxidoreductase group 1
MRLSVLDQSPILHGHTAADALKATVELAKLADRLGYTRYWLAEHHNTSSLADASPEVLIPVVAGATSRIRVGSGGVMLTHYAPLKVAEVFRMLETLFPGRIDMGLGRAPGSDRMTAAALQPGPTSFPIESYPDQVSDLLLYHRGAVPDDHPFRGIRATPAGPGMAEPWLLASSFGSVSYAAKLGLPLSFGHFIADSHPSPMPQGVSILSNEVRERFGPGPELVQWYREHFEPSELFDKPVVSVGVSLTCAETADEAKRLGMARHYMRLRREQGRPTDGVPSLEEIESAQLDEHERNFIAYHSQRAIEGAPSEVRSRLEALAAAYQADELIVLTITPTYETRARSYELLAAEFGLGTYR